MITTLGRNPNLTIAEREASRAPDSGDATRRFGTGVAVAVAADITAAVDSLAAALERAISESVASRRVAATDAFLSAIAVVGATAAVRRAAATDAFVVAIGDAGAAATAERDAATDAFVTALVSAAGAAHDEVIAAADTLVIAIAAASVHALATHAAASAAARTAGTDRLITAVVAAAASRALAAEVASAADAFVLGMVNAAAAACRIADAVDAFVHAVNAAGVTAIELHAALARCTAALASAARAAFIEIDLATDAVIAAVVRAAVVATIEVDFATDGLIAAIASASAAAAEEIAAGTDSALRSVAATGSAAVFAAASRAAVAAAIVGNGADRLVAAVADACAAERVCGTDALLSALNVAARAARLELGNAVDTLVQETAAAALAAGVEPSQSARSEAIRCFGAAVALAAERAQAASEAPIASVPQAAEPVAAEAAQATVVRPRLALVRRGLNALLGSGLLVVYLLSSVVAVASILLLLNGGTASAVFRTPDGPLFQYIAAILTVALVMIAGRYIYFYICWFGSRRHFGHARHVDVDALRTRELPFMKFQVTTKGGAMPVVERSLRSLEAACDKHWWLRARLSVEVITEVEAEATYFERTFRNTSLRVSALCLPRDYQTPNGTGLKARALHYMVERRREGYNVVDGRCFIVHLDEETMITEPHLLVLIDYLASDPRPVSQGPIYYPLEWEKTPWICRAIESTRPFGCSECARVMQHPPPPHLHGSNLVVDEAVENEIGWDFGKLEGNAFVAEDLLFGLRAYSVVGAGAFGWHGATMLEQPPLSLHWAIQQRLRWVIGALQGLRAMWRTPAFSGISLRHKLRLHVSIGYRIATYAGGFPVGLTGLVFLLHPLSEANNMFSSGIATALVRGALLFAALGWVVSYQIGVVRNLRYQDVDHIERARQMGIALLITPITGLCETVGPFIALTRWLFGIERASWTPTPKLAKEDNSVLGAVAVRIESHDNVA